MSQKKRLQMEFDDAENITVSIECNAQIGDILVLDGERVRIFDIMVLSSMKLQRVTTRLYYQRPESKTLEYVEMTNTAQETETLD